MYGVFNFDKKKKKMKLETNEKLYPFHGNILQYLFPNHLNLHKNVNPIA